MKTNEIFELKSLFTDYHNNLSVPMIRLFGLDAAVLISEIYSQWRIKQKRDKYTDRINLYVASTQFNTGLSPVRQRKALKVLSDYGIITFWVSGCPKIRTVCFNVGAFDKLKYDLERDQEKVKEFIESQKAIGAKNREVLQNKKDFEIDGTTLVRYKGNGSHVVIPNSITNVAAVINHYGLCHFAFGAYHSGDCVRSITVPKSLTEINDLTFYGCPNLEKIIVDEHNESYYSEGNCIIERASKMLVVGCKASVIPQGVKGIAFGAFIACGGFAELTYNGTKQQWNDLKKDEGWDVENLNPYIDSPCYKEVWDGRILSYTIHCTDGDITKS